jgi:hypothetical protein
MTELYNDSSNRVFKIRLNVEGVENEELQVRMVLNFTKHNRSYIFYAQNEEDLYILTIPPMSEVHQDSGNMHIEVIANDTIFKPWEDEFIVKNKKKIEIANVATDEVATNKAKLEFEISSEDSEDNKESHEEASIETEEIKKPFNISTMPKKDINEEFDQIFNKKSKNFKTFDQF